MVQTNPALARELRIGRPDLPRQYDGALVDINRVPVAAWAFRWDRGCGLWLSIACCEGDGGDA